VVLARYGKVNLLFLAFVRFLGKYNICKIALSLGLERGTQLGMLN